MRAAILFSDLLQNLQTTVISVVVYGSTVIGGGLMLQKKEK